MTSDRVLASAEVSSPDSSAVSVSSIHTSVRVRRPFGIHTDGPQLCVVVEIEYWDQVHGVQHLQRDVSAMSRSTIARSSAALASEVDEVAISARDTTTGDAIGSCGFARGAHTYCTSVLYGNTDWGDIRTSTALIENTV